MASTCCTSEVHIALKSIISDGKIDETAATAARTYLQTRLKPIADEAAITLLEAAVTQFVFFFVILLIFLILYVVVCGNAVGLSATTMIGIVILFIVISAVFLAVISLAAIDATQNAVSSAITELIQLDTPQDVLDVLNTAAAAYLLAL